MVSMTATPSILRLDPGEVRTTNIYYKTDSRPFFELFVWERYVENDWAWIKSLPTEVFGSDDYLKEGNFSRPLEPGQAYQVRMYHEEFIDPRRHDEPADAEARAVAILKRGPSDLISDSSAGAGGTYFRVTVATRVDTVAFLWVSSEPPVIDPDGFQSLPAVLGDAFSGVRRQFHTLEVASTALLPGNPFHALLFVIDAEGHWQMNHYPFTTKQRRVEVDFVQLHVINDGGEGHNEAGFMNWVLRGDRVYGSCPVPEREISDRPGKETQLEDIDLKSLCGPIVIGPEQVTKDNVNVALLTRGTAERAVGEMERAANFLGPPPAVGDAFPSERIVYHANFPFPIGSKGETVKDQPLVVNGSPLGDAELQYDVTAHVRVDYM